MGQVGAAYRSGRKGVNFLLREYTAARDYGDPGPAFSHSWRSSFDDWMLTRTGHKRISRPIAQPLAVVTASQPRSLRNLHSAALDRAGLLQRRAQKIFFVISFFVRHSRSTATSREKRSPRPTVAGERQRGDAVSG